MENKLELRVGDVVRLKPLTIREIYDDGDLCFKEDVGLISPDLVDEIISRGEIARLEAENERLEAENAKLRRDLQASEQEPDIFINARGICPCEPDRKVVVWLRSGEKVSQDAGCFRWKLDLEKKDDDVFAYMVLPS